MQEAMERAKQALHAASQRYKLHADWHRTAVKIAVGDRVMLSSKNITFRSGGSRKLLPRWLGPFEVTEQINPVAFKLNLQELGGKVHPVFHASLLRLYHTDGRTVVHPAPLQVDGELETRLTLSFDAFTTKLARLSMLYDGRVMALSQTPVSLLPISPTVQMYCVTFWMQRNVARRLHLSMHLGPVL